MLTIEYLTPLNRVTGWSYLWAKKVEGFDPRYHCARCLQGEYQTNFGLAMPVGEAVALSPDAKPGDLFYLCGVAKPSAWENNFHLALEYAPGAQALIRETYRGHILVIRNAVPIDFDDAAARRLYPEKGAQFLNCRNFQFGAHHFGI